MRVQRNYDETFRAEAIKLTERQDRTISQVAEDLGVKASTLHNWIRRDRMRKRARLSPGAGAAGTAATSGSPSAEPTVEERLAVLERENAQLRRENDRLREDRAILKKAAAFFAKESE